MSVIIHVLIALSSVVYVGYVYLHPSRRQFYSSYFLVGATLVTGTGLVVSSPSHMVSACFTGIVYLGFVSAGLVLAHKKLVHNKSLEN